MNILVVTMSLVKPERFAEEIYLTDDGGEPVAGRWTNEAPCKYLVRRLYRQKYTFFDRVIVLATKECLMDRIASQDPDLDGRTTTGFFEHMLLSYMQSLNPEYYALMFPTEEARRGLFRYVGVNPDDNDRKDLQEAFGGNTDNPWDSAVYMDFTGGYRKESLAGLMILRTFGLVGYRIESIVYSFYGKPNRIYDITNIYNMFDAIIAGSRLQSRDFYGVREEAQLVMRDKGIIIDFDAYGGRKEDAGDFAEPYREDGEYIFMSYSHKDMLFAQSFLKNMERRGLKRIWYDEGIDPAGKWEDTLKEKIDECSCFLILLSENYNKSTFCRMELEEALRMKRPVLIIFLDGTLPPEEHKELLAYQGIFYQKYENSRAFYDKVLSAKMMDRFRS